MFWFFTNSEFPVKCVFKWPIKKLSYSHKYVGCRRHDAPNMLFFSIHLRYYYKLRNRMSNIASLSISFWALHTHRQSRIRDIHEKKVIYYLNRICCNPGSINSLYVEQLVAEISPVWLTNTTYLLKTIPPNFSQISLIFENFWYSELGYTNVKNIQTLGALNSGANETK